MCMYLQAADAEDVEPKAKITKVQTLFVISVLCILFSLSLLFEF